jgi:hypothetical protein
MPTTTPEVSFGLYALTIKPDGTPSSASDLQPFSNLDDLRTDNISSQPYASYEPDFWVLNGAYKFIPDDSDRVHVGMMSLDQSNASGIFADPPVLTIQFTEPHSSDGLVLHFSRYTGDYADSIQVGWYTVTGRFLQWDTYEPDGPDFEISESVTGFGKIIITFYSTNQPYRYLRLTGLDYGHLITFSNQSVKSASLIEECDPISARLRANRLELKLFSDDSTFNPFSPTGYYANLKERQPLRVYEYIDNAPIFIGQFFLDEWKNVGDTEIEFKCIDWIGVMDQLPSRGGLFESPGITVDDLLDALLTPEGITYELHSTLANLSVIGWLPTGSLRESLQQIAFTIGAKVDCSRAWTIRIIPTPLASVEDAVALIDSSQKGIDQSLTLLPLVSAINVVAHSYVESTDSIDLFDGILAAGDHEISFDEPVHDLNVSGATITESGANYAIVNVATTGTVTLSGQVYLDNQIIYQASSGEETSKPGLTIEEATLVHAGNVGAVAARVFAYCQQRYQQQVKLFAPFVEVGQVVTVDTLYDRQLKGVIESMSINLAGGMITQAKIIGVEAD